MWEEGRERALDWVIIEGEVNGDVFTISELLGNWFSASHCPCVKKMWLKSTLCILLCYCETQSKL